MTIEKSNNLTILTPDDGMVLKSGYTYSDKVYLGIYDTAENWEEVSADAPREEEPEEVPGEDATEPTDTSNRDDIVQIILGEVD